MEGQETGAAPGASSEDSELVRDTLEAVARPRLTGTIGARDVEAQLRGRLSVLGYEVRELKFRFSALPGRLGIPILGALNLLFTLGAISLLRQGKGPAALLGISALIAATTLLIATFPTVIRRLRWGGSEGVNWLVQRAGTRPRYVMCAHRDSKSQFLPTLLRMLAAILALAGTALLFLLSLLATLVPSLPLGGVASVLGVPAVLGGVLLLLCWSGNASPGALDNASGIAALIGVAARELASDDVAFLVTDAEELGLAGASAVARQLPAGIVGIINMDGLDDDGSFYVIERFGWPRAQGAAPHLAAALLASAHTLGYPAERRDLPFGMMVDHIRFIQAGIPALTIMRGTRRSLLRVHRPSDNLTHLTGAGATSAIALVSGALAVLRANEKVVSTDNGQRTTA
jgi:hypothetical protein